MPFYTLFNIIHHFFLFWRSVYVFHSRILNSTSTLVSCYSSCDNTLVRAVCKSPAEIRLFNQIVTFPVYFLYCWRFQMQTSSLHRKSNQAKISSNFPQQIKGPLCRILGQMSRVHLYRAACCAVTVTQNGQTSSENLPHFSYLQVAAWIWKKEPEARKRKKRNQLLLVVANKLKNSKLIIIVIN